MQNVAPSEVWAALKLAMEGQNESARVSASKVLMDALAERREEQDWRAEREKAGADARAKLGQLLQQRASVAQRKGQTELAQELSAAAVELWPPDEDLPAASSCATSRPRTRGASSNTWSTAA